MGIKRLKQHLLFAVFIAAAALFEFSTSIHHSLPSIPHDEGVRTDGSDYPFRTSFLQPGESSPCAELEWLVDTVANVIQFRLKTAVIRTEEKSVSEWIAFGMSANGSLIDADLIVFYSHRNRIKVEDSWTDRDRNLHRDIRQDYKVLSNVITQDNHMLVVFTRPIDTCDHRDYHIEDGTVHLLFLRGYHSPPSRSSTITSLHNPTTSAMRRVQMMKQTRGVPHMQNDVQINEVLVDEIVVPVQTTTYWCKIHKFENIRSKQHIIRYEAVVSHGNEDLVHHMEVYLCEPRTTLPGYSGPCKAEDRPSSLRLCKHVIGAWAMGAEPFIYPEDVGVAIGQSVKSTYVMIEIHYNNPTHRQGVVDSSGIRFYHTSHLRPNDAGILEVGVVYSPNQSIPPKSRDFTLTGYCTPDCTKKSLPEGGIKAFASQLHTHLTGRAVWTQHVRRGVELSELNRDNHFSAQFQEIRLLPETVNILPGDTLTTHCRYDTMARDNITLGGYGIEDEMCVNYIHYYPSVNLEVCKSTVSKSTLFTFLKHVGGKIDQTSAEEALRHVTWDDRTKLLWQTVIDRAPIDVECLQSSGKPFKGKWTNQLPPSTRIYRPKKRRQCRRQRHMDWKHLLSLTFDLR